MSLSNEQLLYLSALAYYNVDGKKNVKDNRGEEIYNLL